MRRIHKWGFNRQLLPICGSAAWQASYAVAARLWIADEERTAKELCDSLSDLFRPMLGIARISKFIAFLNQPKLGIYDSRVSFALESVTYQNKRLFPLVPPQGKEKACGDAHSVLQRYVPVAYLLYLEFMRLLAGALNTSVSHIEMALFMMGRDRERAKRLPLNTALYASLHVAEVVRLTEKLPQESAYGSPTRRFP